MIFFYILSIFSDPNRSPGQRSLNAWPLHTPKGKEYLEIHPRFSHEADKSVAVGQGPRAQQCAFWKEYLPHLVTATSKYAECFCQFNFTPILTSIIIAVQVKIIKFLFIKI